MVAIRHRQRLVDVDASLVKGCDATEEREEGEQGNIPKGEKGFLFQTRSATRMHSTRGKICTTYGEEIDKCRRDTLSKQRLYSGSRVQPLRVGKPKFL